MQAKSAILSTYRILHAGGERIQLSWEGGDRKSVDATAHAMVAFRALSKDG